MLSRGLRVGVLTLALLLAACSGLAGEPQVIATLPPQEVMSQAQPVRPPAATEEVGQAQGAAAIPPGGEVDLALGARIFAENCTRCHGVNGEGDGELVQSGQVTMPVDFTDPAAAESATPESWYDIITNGRLDKLMPPWKDELTDEERWAVTMYVYTLSQNFQLVKGVVSGQVLNGTAGASIPADLTVTLHVVDQSFTRDETLETTAAPDGTFRFEDVPMRSNRGYVVTTDYQDTLFASSMLPGDPSAAVLELPLTIYEFTDDPSVVTIEHITAQVSIDPGGRLLQVVESVLFNNTSDKVFRAEDGTSVRLTAPAGAQFSEFMTETTGYLYSEDKRQMMDTSPLIPNVPRNVHVMYNLPYAGSVEIRRPLDYPVTDGFEVLVGTPGITIGGDGIEALGGRTTARGTLMSFGTRSALPSGGELRFIVSGSPAPSGSAASTAVSVPPIAIVFIALGVLAIAAAGVLYLKERQGQAQAVSAAAASDIQARINALVHEIAMLDMQQPSDEANSKAQAKRRAALKAELMTLIKDNEKSN